MESISGYRLSPPQRHLWALLQDAAPGARGARALLRLRGALDRAALDAALDALVARHEVLRTSFERLPGMPEALQVVEERALACAPDEDLRALAAAPRGARVDALWAGGGEETLPAAHLLRTGDQEHLLLLRAHALGVDAASWEHLARDLAALYAAERGGGAVEDEPVPYLAVSEWLNEVAASDEAEAGRAWWARQCEGPETVLPLEREAPAGAPEGEPAPARRTLSPALAAAPDAVLLAGWKALLHRLGRARTVRVAVAFDGRADDELRHAVGPFTRHLPLATAVDGDAPFAALAERVRGALDDAAGWQECYDGEAVARLVEGGGAPFRMGFSVLGEAAAHAGGGVEFAVERSRGADDPFALHLRVRRSGGGAALELAGGPTVPPAQLDLLLERYEALLADALARPDAPVDALRAMSAAERTRLMEFSRSRTSPAEGARTVHAMIEAQAARTPDAPALRSGAETVAYAALNAGANRRARHLRALGVGPETRVGIMLPSSPRRVETVLAVLKAGGAYVPLDPAYPADRLAFMVRDAGLALVLTDAGLRARVPEVAGTAVASWDDVEDAVAAQADGDPGVAVDPASAAYVIYTSGSTGTPKGVLVEHRALAAHARAVQAHYGLGPDDRILQFASFNFDASVEQTLPPLASGACVVLRGEAVSSVESLGRYVGDGLTILNLPTAQWHLLAQAWAGGEPAPGMEALRLVIAGGEAMLPYHAALWGRTPARGARLLNAYGPTEAVVTATTFDIPAGAAFAGAPRHVSIGRPFGGRAAYVLDPALGPAPAGVPGELFLGGDALARSYLGRPALTAERFVPDPFGDPGARLYRTGDLARWDEDGTLAFLGRADRQVKVRGFRIELGEVETALNHHPEVTQCAVVVEEKGEGEKQLTAYWIPAGEPLPTPAALRDWLLERLPEYMVPGVFVALETMPLTAVGKVDRDRLGAGRRVQAERTRVAPATPTEEAVAGIWGEVMRQERVSMDDDFFAVGGHSLLATQLTSRLRRHFSIDLQVGRVFEARTVADLARVVDGLAAARGDDAGAGEGIARAARDGRRVGAAELAALVDP